MVVVGVCPGKADVIVVVVSLPGMVIVVIVVDWGLRRKAVNASRQDLELPVE